MWCGHLLLGTGGLVFCKDCFAGLFEGGTHVTCPVCKEKCPETACCDLPQDFKDLVKSTATQSSQPAWPSSA